MIFNIREGVFETNSSSTHSVIVARKKIMREFIDGKHKINLITQQIVSEEEFEEAIKISETILNKYVELEFDRIETAKFFEISENYELPSIVDVAHKHLNKNKITNIGGKDISYIQFKNILREHEDFRRVVMKYAATLSLITFEQMNRDCELRYENIDIYRDPNGEIFSSISIYGSDSYDTGDWPTS